MMNSLELLPVQRSLPRTRIARACGLAFSLALAAFAVSACAIQKTSEPASIPISVDFPSTAAAVQTDSVTVSVFDSNQQCTDLITLVQTGQQLPAAIQRTAALAPCQLLNNQGNSVDLPLHDDYTFLAVGEIKGNPVFIGCTVQNAFGNTEALSVPISFINDKQSLNPTNCGKLSDKCNHTGCQ
jgi:hypothetical protein